VTAIKWAVVAFLVWLWHAYLMFVIVLATFVGMQTLLHRSETASLLLGRPVDERWESINTRAFALAAKVTLLVLWAALMAMAVMEADGARLDSTPFLLIGATLLGAYLGGVIWYRWRQ
jgi:heme/copper-type cytochrome/quinol oxidase subunit 3